MLNFERPILFIEVGMFENLAKWLEYELGHVLISKKSKKVRFIEPGPAFMPIGTWKVPNGPFGCRSHVRVLVHFGLLF